MNDEGNKSRLERLESRVSGLDAILRGDPQTGKGGLVSLADRTGEAVFGNQNSPGVIADVEDIKKTIWKATGGLAVFMAILELILRILIH